jgi:hypothetical protein
VKKAPEDEFVNLVKQTYRVLLTRGMKGCYVYFEDAATREFFLSPALAAVFHIRGIGRLWQNLQIFRQRSNKMRSSSSLLRAADS